MLTWGVQTYQSKPYLSYLCLNPVYTAVGSGFTKTHQEKIGNVDTSQHVKQAQVGYTENRPHHVS